MKSARQQLWRYRFQALFLLLTGLLAGRLSLWLQAHQAGRPAASGYPEGIDLFLPLNGLGALIQGVASAGAEPAAHPAAVTLLLTALVAALLMRRGLCGWLCPVFPLSELLWRLGERCCGRTWSPPFWLDLLLRLGKYLLLAAVVVSAGRAAFPAQPAQPWVDPVPPAFWLLLASCCVAGFFVQHAWCRYLCPYGALLGLFSIVSPLRIRRSPAHCVRCHRCVQHCPAWLPVMHLTSVRSPECFACFSCIDSCPAPAALAMSPGTRPIQAWQYGLGLLLIFLGGLLVGSLTGR